MNIHPEAEKYANADFVLTDKEMRDELNVFLAVLTDVAFSLSEGEEPTALTWMFARGVAADIWRYNRETGDGKAMAEAMGIESYSVQRQSVWRETQGRTRIKRAHLESALMSRDAYKELRKGIKGQNLANPKLKVVK